MEQKDRDSLFYNLKELRGTVKRIETSIQYDAIEMNKKLKSIEDKLDFVIQRTDMLEKPSVYNPERLYTEHQNGVSYKELANRSGLSFSQVRTRVAKYKKKVERELLGGLDYE